MSIAGASPVLSAIDGIVCCPTCGLPAIVEVRFARQDAGGPAVRLRTSCAGGHGWLLLADRVRSLALCDDLDVASPGDHADGNVKIMMER